MRSGGRGGRAGGFSGGGRSIGGGVRSGGGRSTSGFGGGLGGGFGAPRPSGRPPRQPASVRRPSSSAGSFAKGMMLGGMMANGGARRRRHFGRHPMGGGMHHPMGMGGGHFPRARRRSSGGSFLAIILFIVVIAFLLSTFASTDPLSPAGNIPASTISRDAIPSNVANTNAPMLRDDLGWIESPAVLNRGMSSFFSVTGVWPTLYITNNIAGSYHPVQHLRNNMVLVDAYLEQMFTAIDNNAANMIVLVYDDGNDWDVWLRIGGQAIMVMDNQAQNILIGYIESMWHGNLDTDEMFNRAFGNAGERIMRITRPWWHVPLIVSIVSAAVLAIGFGTFSWWKKKKAQENLEMQQAQQILETEFDNAPSPEADRLMQQYTDDEDN